MAVVLSWRNLAEESAVEVSASAEAVSGGVRSVLTPQMGDVWQSAAAVEGVTQTLTVDLGATATGIKLLAVAGPRDGPLFSTGVSNRFTASTVASGGSDTLNASSVSGFPGGGNVHALLIPAGISARWITFRMQRTVGAADVNFQLSRIWIASDVLVTAAALGQGYTRGGMDTGSSERAGLSGARYAGRGAVFRRRTIPIPQLTAAEADTLRAAGEAVGTTGQLFASISDASQEALSAGALFGRFTEVPTVEQPIFGLRVAALTMEEDL